MEKIGRRSFLFGLMTAPAIVRASSLMSISAVSEPAGIVWTATQFNRLLLPDFDPQVALPLVRFIVPYRFAEKSKLSSWK